MFDGSSLPDDFVYFFRFVATQYIRTPRMAAAVVGPLREIPNFNAEAAWGLVRTIFATNLAYGFYARRRQLRLTFLDAAGGDEFITGDQPIVNVRAIGLPQGQPPSESDLELFYPLAPTCALLLAFDSAKPTTERKPLTKAEIEVYGQIIATASEEQLYARSEEPLVVTDRKTAGSRGTD